MSDISSLIQGLEAVKNTPPQDPAVRAKLYEAVRSAYYAVEPPIETVRRLSFAPAQLSMARLAIDLKLFNILSARSEPATLQELCLETGAEDLLLRRILRFLAAYGMIKQTSPESYAASPATHSLAVSGFQAGIRHYHDGQLPTTAAVPRFLASTSYKNPKDSNHTAFQLGHNTELPAWAYAMQKPEVFKDFNEWMAVQREGEKSWLDVFPAEQILAKDSTSSGPVFVDVGGGIGHQCAALKQKLPQLKQPIVLQDLPPAIAHAIPIPGVEATVHDFWNEQPVKGASFYYMRNVLHDYPDEKCVVLLNKTIDAMGPDSVILVDEMVLPEMGCHYLAAELDITMMAGLAAMERTDKQWNGLFEKVGLVVKERYTYLDSMNQSVMVVARKAS